MDLRELESFVVVAEELHVGRAARRLVISQPALTQRIQRLERELGFLLFTRAERRIALTPAGVVVLERARRLLGDVAEMVDSAARVSTGRLGSLRIGHTGAAVYGALTPVVRQLREDVPDVELVLVELKTAPQIELVNAGSLDAGFIHLPRSPLAGLFVLELDDEHKVVALPSEHPLARHRQINLGQLAREPFILFDRALEPDTYDRLHEACRRHGFQPDIVQMTTNLQSTIGLVAAGLGVALIMESVAAGMQRSGVDFRPLKPAELMITNGVVWRSQNANPALAVLEEALHRHQAGRTVLGSRSLAGS